MEGAIQKIRMAEDVWNTKVPEKIAAAYAPNSWWRNRGEFIVGREQIIIFLQKKWERELEYRLIKELWAYGEHRISVRFQYEYHNHEGQWFRAYGNENWEFAKNGLMSRREASINDVMILETQRKFFWPLGARPVDHLGLKELDV